MRKPSEPCLERPEVTTEQLKIEIHEIGDVPQYNRV